MQHPAPPSRRILIVGSGAMGCLLACRWRDAAVQMTVLTRDPRRAADLARQGITLECPNQPPAQHLLQTETWQSPQGPADLIILCVKAGILQSALAGLHPFLKPESVLWLMQNGIEALRTAETLHPGHLAIAGSVSWGAYWRTPQCLVVSTGGGITLALPNAESHAAARPWLDSMEKSHIPVSLHPSPQIMLWKKLILNAAVNPVTALYRLHNGELPGHPEAWCLALAAAREAQQAAAAEFIVQDFADPEKSLRDLCTQTAGNRSSMWQDLENRRPTEIEFITGAVIRSAQRHHLAVPVNEQLYRRVREREKPKQA